MPSRSFVVRVIEPAARVVVEDVRTGTSAVVRTLDGVGPQIERWVGGDDAPTRGAGGAREHRVKPDS
jgi:hypothetical protein